MQTTALVRLALYGPYPRLFGMAPEYDLRYLDLFQSNLQLSWWAVEVFRHYVSIFEEFVNVVDVCTGRPTRGRN